MDAHNPLAAGRLIETAIWLDGTETDEDMRRWKEETIPASIRDVERRDKVLTGPITFTEKRPGDDRVPPVPKHIHGPNVRLLVAEAMVVGAAKPIIEVGFIGDLTDEDLVKLRRLTRGAYAKQNPTHPALTDRQCDQIINMLGPQSAVATLRLARDQGGG